MRITELARPGCMGKVEVKAIWDEPGSPDHGSVVYHHKGNVVTFDAREVMAHALAGDVSGHLTTVGWGTGTTAAQRSDTTLQTQVITSAIILPVAYPTPESVVFSSVLPRGVGTGSSYSEVGLLASDGTLFARFVFPAQYKFDQLRLSVNWQIIFV